MPCHHNSRTSWRKWLSGSGGVYGATGHPQLELLDFATISNVIQVISDVYEKCDHIITHPHNPIRDVYFYFLETGIYEDIAFGE